MNRHRARSAIGAPLVAGGLAVLLSYGLLVWLAVYNNDEQEHVCNGPHRDIFFPPATICGTGGHTVRVTSMAATVAGSMLFLLGLGLLGTGVVTLLHERTRHRRQRPEARMASQR